MREGCETFSGGTHGPFSAFQKIDQLRAALHTIRAFCERRMNEGTREHADMCHIANIVKEAA